MLSSASSTLAAWLGKRIRESPPGTRLPTIRTLAREFGLPLSAVRTAVDALRKSGRVTTVRGRGTFTPFSGDTAAPETPRSAPESLAAHLDGLLTGGAIPHGRPLPPVKALRMQFHVTEATVIAAYRILRRAGRICKVGRTYFAGTFERAYLAGPQRDVYVFYEREEALRGSFHNGYLAPLFREMQDELQAHNHVLRFARYGRFPELAATWKRTGNAPAGVLLHGMARTRYRDVLPSIRRLLARDDVKPADIPSLVIDWHKSNVMETPGAVTNFNRGHISTSAGRTLTDVLAGQRIRKYVFFSSITDAAWDANWPFGLLKIKTDLQAAAPDGRIRFVARYDPERTSPQEMHGEFRDRYYRTWGNVYDLPPWDAVWQDIRPTTDFKRTFKRHLTSPVWVFSRDRDAATALAWAERHRIRVPRDLTVIGLENDPYYFPLGISACVPDWKRTGYLLAHALINDFPVKRSSKGYIATAARFHARLTGSTG